MSTPETGEVEEGAGLIVKHAPWGSVEDPERNHPGR